MIAASTPAVRRPIKIGSPTKRFNIAESTAGGGIPDGKRPLAHAPTNAWNPYNHNAQRMSNHRKSKRFSTTSCNANAGRD